MVLIESHIKQCALLTSSTAWCTFLAGETVAPLSRPRTRTLNEFESHPKTCFSCPINWPEHQMWVNPPAKSHFQTKAHILSIVVVWVQNKWSMYGFWSLIFIYILECYFVDIYFLIWYNLKEPKTQIPTTKQRSLLYLGTACYLYSLTGSKAVDIHPGE